jgi:hypothetical protein
VIGAARGAAVARRFPCVPADSHLAEDDRTTRRELHRNGHNEQQRSEKQKREERERDVRRTFQEPGGRRQRFQPSQRQAQSMPADPLRVGQVLARCIRVDEVR